MRSLPAPTDMVCLDFVGNVAQNAIVLGDCDNDGLAELAVGSLDGAVTVFKGEESDGGAVRPFWTREGLGHVTALCVGDLANSGENSLVVLAADGWCHVFNVEGPDDGEEGKEESEEGESKEEEGGAEKPEREERKAPANQPIMRQRLPPNVKEALLFDVNNDGLVELVVALTDRVVRTYQWRRAQDGGGFLASLNKWEFGGQVGSITLNRASDGSNALIVSQPGGALLRVNCRGVEKSSLLTLERRKRSEDDDEADSCQAGEGGGGDEEDKRERLMRSIGDVDYEEMATYQMRDPNVSSEIVGDFRGSSTSDDRSSAYAIATLDGNLILARNNEILWSHQLPEELCCLRKLDVNGDGKDEVVVTSWGGSTFIVDQSGRLTEVPFSERVCTFTCGRFSFGGGDTRNVLVYVTYRGKIFLDHRVEMIQDDLLSLQVGPSLKSALDSRGVSFDGPRQEQELNAFLLYGFGGAVA